MTCWQCDSNGCSGIAVIEAAPVLEDITAVDDGGGLEMDLFRSLENFEEKSLMAAACYGRHASVIPGQC